MKHPLRPALLMLLAVAACSTSLQRQQWKVAVRADDIGVYKGFLIQLHSGARTQVLGESVKSAPNISSACKRGWGTGWRVAAPDIWSGT